MQGNLPRLYLRLLVLHQLDTIHLAINLSIVVPSSSDGSGQRVIAVIVLSSYESKIFPTWRLEDVLLLIKFLIVQILHLHIPLGLSGMAETSTGRYGVREAAPAHHRRGCFISRLIILPTSRSIEPTR